MMMCAKVAVLNGDSTESQPTTSAVELSRELQKLMLSIKGRFMSEDGRGVDYTTLESSELFGVFVTKSRDLRFVNLSSLDSSEKTAFFLNVYNALTIHGLVVNKGDTLPSSVLEINNFWQKTAYNIGGHVLSLDDIEHGILRGNRIHPSSRRPLFTEEDPRYQLTVTPVDPRIHFALVCGAKSCPAINVYSARNLEQGLEAATRSFCAQEVQINGKHIMLSKIFHWYKEDFASDDSSLLRWISRYLPIEKKEKILELIQCMENGENIPIKSNEYNWSLNKL